MFNQTENNIKQGSFFLSVTDLIKNLNGRKKAKSITCFDFQTLHTNIPHDKLVRVLNEHIDFCFKGGMEIYCS